MLRTMKDCHVIYYVVAAVFLGLIVSQPDILLSHEKGSGAFVL